MKVAITGANGLFGQALVRVIGSACGALPLTRADADLTRLPDVRRVLLSARPDAVVHAAAAPDPDACERNPDYAFQTNVVATENIVQVAKELAIPVAQISTDAVFDGLADSPRTESDPTRPLSVYGKTKLLAEQAVLQLERYWIFRVSVLFGPGKANFISKGLLALGSGDPYAVAADQIGTATYTLDAARKILEVMEREQFGLFHLSNTGVCSRFDLMQRAAVLAGLFTEGEESIGSADVLAGGESIDRGRGHPRPKTRNTGAFRRPRSQLLVGKPLSEMGRLAPRPKYAVMEMKALKMAGIALPRPWQDALAEYIETCHRRTDS